MIEDVTLVNTVTGQSLHVDMTTTQDYVLISLDWGSVSSTHHSYRYVDQVGEYVTGTNIGTRSFEMIGYVIADNETIMAQRKSTLNAFVNPQQPIDVLYKDFVIRMLPDMSVRYTPEEQSNNEVMCKFNIVGFIPDPLFSDQLESKVAAASTFGMFRFPLVISANPNPPGGAIFGLRQPSLIVPVVNKGTMPAGMRIVFYAKGSVSNPSLYNIATQEQFKINKVLVAGEIIEVTTTLGNKKVIGAVADASSNYYKYVDYSSVWLQLAVGNNLLRYDADANKENLEVYIYYRNQYMEVEQ